MKRTGRIVALVCVVACAAACVSNELGDANTGAPSRGTSLAVTGGGGEVATPKHKVRVMVTPGRVTSVETPKHTIRLGAGAPRMAQQELTP